MTPPSNTSFRTRISQSDWAALVQTAAGFCKMFTEGLSDGDAEDQANEILDSVLGPPVSSDRVLEAVAAA